MIHRSLDYQSMSKAYDMLVQPLLSQADVETLPFGSGYGVVEPKRVSKGHVHHESEVFIILKWLGQGYGQRRQPACWRGRRDLHSSVQRA